MERATVDFGIDLGTSNSCIARLDGTTTHVIKTNDGVEHMPSAVSVDRKGKLRVGQKAKDQRMSTESTEHSDVCLEFKLRMGHSEPFQVFEATGEAMTSEELSAEVLKELRAQVQRNSGEDITSAAISVPAAFELPQCAATDRAAKLAGLSFSPLVQEPVAAALAYGFQTTSDRVFWMVYDFGGGTFDAAIMRVRDEQIQVVNHGGDNHLGGKLIDWEIVNQLLVPVVQRELGLSPNDQRWGSIRSVLKYYAELAKIRLSVEDVTDIEIRQLFLDERGRSVSFECELKRNSIETLAEPFVEKSINKCRAVLEESRLSSGDIEKLILVGGPTKTPLFREMLASKLGIQLELRVDPLTVVACGAAMFAGTQRVPEACRERAPLSAGQVKLELDYEPIGDETKPAIGGRLVPHEGESLDGYTLEFFESKTSSWRSGKLDVGPNGTFIATVHAERDRKNEYRVELRDASGNLHETVPDRFTYTIGITISAQLLVNSIGIALADNQLMPFLEKNTPLPAKYRSTSLQTTVAVKGGDLSGTLLRIPVVEGSNKRADRNPLIGSLVVSGDHVRRDVPIGSDIELTITVDESRQVSACAYIPILDEEFALVFHLDYPEIEEQALIEQADKAKARLEKLSERTQDVSSAQADAILKEIEEEKAVHCVDASLQAGQDGDPEAFHRCQRLRSELDAKLDEIEDLMLWPAMVSEAEAEISQGRELVREYGDSQDVNDFTRLEEETRAAITSQDPDALQQRARRLSQLITQVLMKHPGFWVGQFEQLEERYKGQMSDQREADRLVAQGHQAMNNEDLEGLKLAVHQLWQLMPDALSEDLRGYKSTVMKKGF